jgi:hypothetical protein
MPDAGNSMRKTNRCESTHMLEFTAIGFLKRKTKIPQKSGIFVF